MDKLMRVKSSPLSRRDENEAHYDNEAAVGGRRCSSRDRVVLYGATAARTPVCDLPGHTSPIYYTDDPDLKK